MAPWHGTGRYSLAQIADRNKTSMWSDQPAEGMIVRPQRPSSVRVAKLVRQGFKQRTDQSWKGAPMRNELMSLHR